MIYPVGVLAALLLGTGYVLQQRVAVTVPESDILRFRLLFDLMHRPLWWAGVGCMVMGQLLSGLALQLASVGLVEPLLSTNLLFALALAALLARHRPKWTEIGGAVLLSAALGVFLSVGNPHSVPHPYPPTPIVIAAVAAVVAVAGACVIMGKRSGVVGEAIWLALGAGLLFGLQDACTRAALVQYDRHGFSALFLHVWVYLLIGAAVLGILLAQSAFKVARLDYSLPPVTAAEPVVGIALGIALLGDRVSMSAGALAVEALCVLALVGGVALIGRSPGLAAACRAAGSSDINTAAKQQRDRVTSRRVPTPVPSSARGDGRSPAA